MAVPLAPFQRFAMWALSPFVFSRLHNSRCCCFNTSSDGKSEFPQWRKLAQRKSCERYEDEGRPSRVHRWSGEDAV